MPVLHAKPAGKLRSPYLSIATNHYLLPSKHHVCCPLKAEEKEDDFIKDQQYDLFHCWGWEGQWIPGLLLLNTTAVPCIPEDTQQFWVQRRPKGLLKPDFFLWSLWKHNKDGRFGGWILILFTSVVVSLCFGLQKYLRSYPKIFPSSFCCFTFKTPPEIASEEAGKWKFIARIPGLSTNKALPSTRIPSAFSLRVPYIEGYF